MPKHLHRDLERLTKDILTVGGLVEQAIDKAIAALLQRRPELADEVVAGDRVIDEREVEVEEDCLKILALHQPVAADLRFIVAALKVNNDLERMGDHAANIADRAVFLATHPPLDEAAPLAEIARRVRGMVRDALDSLVNRDADKARLVCVADAEVDREHRAMYALIQARMKADPDAVERATQVLSVSRQLERIADLATNIAQDVVFMVEGTLIRHRPPMAGRSGAQ